MSISDAARQLKTDRRTLRGFALGIKVSLIPVGKSLAMSRADFRRLRGRLEGAMAAEALSLRSQRSQADDDVTV